MKVTAIIAEYNPFHNGHRYHLDAARALTGADYIIVLMSGNYTQRGVPAVMDKYLRTQMALSEGADLVLELPLPFATGSAEFFATGAVAILQRLGAVDFLCFGSECGQLAPLQTLAAVLNEEPPCYTDALKEGLKSGLSFPAARTNALLAACKDLAIDDTVLSSPNNILGVEYIRALLRENSSIQPVTLTRTGSGYNDTVLRDTHSSAMAIRRSFLESNGTAASRTQVPEGVYSLLSQNWGKTFPLYAGDFSLLLQYSLLQQLPDSLAAYLDVTQELSNRIYKLLPSFTTFDGFCSALKTKDMTYTRISRCLLHILLAITDEQMQACAALAYAPYARILGFRSSSAGTLLKKIKDNCTVPLLSRLADAPSLLSPDRLALLQKEITASHIYEAVISQKFHTEMRNEYKQQILVL